MAEFNTVAEVKAAEFAIGDYADVPSLGKSYQAVDKLNAVGKCIVSDAGVYLEERIDRASELGFSASQSPLTGWSVADGKHLIPDSETADVGSMTSPIRSLYGELIKLIKTVNINDVDNDLNADISLDSSGKLRFQNLTSNGGIELFLSTTNFLRFLIGKLEVGDLDFYATGTRELTIGENKAIASLQTSLLKVRNLVQSGTDTNPTLTYASRVTLEALMDGTDQTLTFGADVNIKHPGDDRIATDDTLTKANSYSVPVMLGYCCGNINITRGGTESAQTYTINATEMFRSSGIKFRATGDSDRTSVTATDAVEVFLDGNTAPWNNYDRVIMVATGGERDNIINFCARQTNTGQECYWSIFSIDNGSFTTSNSDINNADFDGIYFEAIFYGVNGTEESITANET